MRFRYYDGTRWLESFDSLQEGRLPIAVEVMVWFRPWPGDLQAEDREMPDTETAERRTFDSSGGFDELAFARASDLDQFDEPAPDRFRVITIPDARPQNNSEEGPQSLARGP